MCCVKAHTLAKMKKSIENSERYNESGVDLERRACYIILSFYYPTLSNDILRTCAACFKSRSLCSRVASIQLFQRSPLKFHLIVFPLYSDQSRGFSATTLLFISLWS